MPALFFWGKTMKDLWIKYKEIILYVFFGGLTTLVSLVSYAASIEILAMHPLLANIISWILAVSFAYVTNKIWVFSSKNRGIKGILKEAISFYAGRLATLCMEEGILLVGITLLAWNAILVKLAAQFLVLVANYLLSKLLIFRQ